MLTEAQKDVKIAYLEQENNRLRAALLDYQIISGEITFQGETPQAEPSPGEEQEG